MKIEMVVVIGEVVVLGVLILIVHIKRSIQVCMVVKLIYIVLV